MKCIKCGSNMYVDDVDYRFEGNKDVYYVCDNYRISSWQVAYIKYIELN